MMLALFRMHKVTFLRKHIENPSPAMIEPRLRSIDMTSLLEDVYLFRMI